jgi:ubiquinone/menaquinone biosynthesis C-methylase UbiE
MRKISDNDINTPEYWNEHETATNFGLRQEKYAKLAGSGNRIVELGCGLSPFVAKISSFAECYGVDFSPKTIETASRQYPHVKYILSDCTKTPFENKFFDVSVSGEVIEHLRNPEAFIAEMARITKRRMILSTPNMEYDDAEHLWEFNEEDLIKMFSLYGKSKCETIHSEWFLGRSYIFVVCDLI